MDDLSRFCCQNSECPDYGKRGGGNLPVCGRYGPRHRRASGGRLRMCFGTPHTANSSANTSITLSAMMPRPTSSARHSRVYSSTIVSHFSGRPSRVRSWMKSHAHTWSFCSARRRAHPWALCPKCRFFRCFCGTFSPSRRHSR